MASKALLVSLILLAFGTGISSKKFGGLKLGLIKDVIKDEPVKDVINININGGNDKNVVTQTLTSKVYTSTVGVTLVNGICATLVNVTGACRRRRGIWVDEPIFITFDDDDGDFYDYFDPTAIYTVERTPLPEIRPNDRLTNGYWGFPSSPHTHVQPSIPQVPVWNDYYNVQSRSPNPFFFNKFIKYFNNLVTITKTVFTTITEITSTSLITVTTSTKTFLIEKCTPSPFPYKICN